MTRLIGRDDELEDLRRSLDEAGTLVLVSGDAGVGKSRLVREALSTRNDSVIVWGRPEQVSTPGPFALVIDALQYIVDTFHSRSIISEASATLDRLADPRVAGELPLRRIAAEMRGIFSMLGDQPVGVFEDLHASDESSQAILAHLARSAKEDRYLLVATFRNEEVLGNERLQRFLETVTRERLAVEIAIPPLSLASAMELAEAILPPTATRITQRRIAELSEGNPFFVEELASTYSAEPESLPASITRIISAKRAALGPVAEQLTKVAALMWGPIDIDVLAIACEMDRSTVVRAVSESTKAGLLHSRDEHIVFRHALIREAIRKDLLNVEVEDLNARIARSIEQIYHADLSAHALALAQHWYWARHRQRAMHWALSAGRRALEYASTAEAQSAFELALACVDGTPPAEALLGLAEVEIRDGRTESASELFDRAVRGFEQAGQFDEAAAALGRSAWMRTITQSGDPLECIDDALVLAQKSGTGRQVARLLAQKGQILVHRLGRLHEGTRLLSQALESAMGQDDLVVQAECFDTLAWAAEHARRQGEADKNAEQASNLAIKSGAAETIGRTLNNRSLLLTLHGNPGDALKHLAFAREWLRGSFGASGISVIDLTEAIARWRMGEPAAVRGLVAARDNVWAHWRGYARMLDAWSSVHAADNERAHRIVQLRWREVGVERDEVVDWDGVVGPDTFEAAACELVVAREIGLGGLSHLATALMESSRGRTADDHLLATVLAGAIFMIDGISELALRALDETFEELEAYKSPYFRGLANELAALVNGPKSQQHQVAHLELAIDALESCDNSIDRARSSRVLADMIRLDRPGDSIALARSARALALEAGSQLEQARSEALLRSLGVRPRAGRPKKSIEDSKALTVREREVAVLVASGSTNAEIATRLFLSDRTVQDHITHALRKIGASGRAGLAAWAVKNGLV